jgi:hypothetical protein
MKQLDINAINQLLSIINIYPSIRIMHFSQNQPNLNSSIVKFSEINDYEFQINSTTKEDYESSISQFSSSSKVSITHFNLKRPRYNMQSKQYDYLFVSSTIIDGEILDFLKKSHSIIKNAGLILIFIDRIDKKRDYDTIYRWSSLLEESYFVATNTIDISEDFDVIISKKMHGWGG